jgi:MipA family protein
LFIWCDYVRLNWNKVQPETVDRQTLEGVSMFKSAFATIALPFCAICALTLLPAVSRAQDTGPGLSFELGGGVSILPSYEGADSFAVGGYPIIKFNRLQLSNGFTIGGDDGKGFGLRPSFGVRGERDSADHPELTGLNTIDTAVELGVGADYEIDQARFYGDIRRGVTGHDGFVGELGAELVLQPIDRLTFSAGPRLSFADSEYMNTYFGVTAAEALASGKPAYTADGGLKSAGISARVRYEFSNQWGVEGSAAWDRLVGDAADSPIVQSEDQFSARFGVFRKFSIDF